MYDLDLRQDTFFADLTRNEVYRKVFCNQSYPEIARATISITTSCAPNKCLR